MHNLFHTKNILIHYIKWMLLYMNKREQLWKHELSLVWIYNLQITQSKWLTGILMFETNMWSVLYFDLKYELNS
jgi:hypothetical protein